jgi:predicted nucleotidyltransferase
MPSSIPLTEALFPKARNAILGLLFGHPDEAYYLRQVARVTGLSVGNVQREVRRLTQAGIIRRFERGMHVYFQADADCPIYEELRAIVTKTVGAAEVVRDALRPLADRIACAFLFGSVARGQEDKASDIDLMVIGDATFGDVVHALHDAESALNREINPTVYPPAEFKAKLAGRHHFLTSVLKGVKLFVVGGDDELTKLAR